MPKRKHTRGYKLLLIMEGNGTKREADIVRDYIINELHANLSEIFEGAPPKVFVSKLEVIK